MTGGKLIDKYEEANERGLIEIVAPPMPGRTEQNY
jgi:hypothetical protein